MPQHQLIPTTPATTGVRITIKEPVSPSKTGFDVEVAVMRDGGPAMPVFHQNYHGLMVDLLTDVAMEAASAFLFGQPGDVLRACNANAKVARAHARRHQYSHPF